MANLSLCYQHQQCWDLIFSPVDRARVGWWRWADRRSHWVSTKLSPLYLSVSPTLQPYNLTNPSVRTPTDIFIQNKWSPAWPWGDHWLQNISWGRNWRNVPKKQVRISSILPGNPSIIWRIWISINKIYIRGCDQVKTWRTEWLGWGS